MGGGGIAPLLMDPAVQQELHMTAQQVSLVQRRMQGAFQIHPANTAPAQLEAQMERRTADLERAVAAILSDVQLKRARQLSLQLEGGAALARSEIADQLDLTPDQRKQVAGILRTSRDKTRAVMETLDPRTTPPAAAQTAMTRSEAIRKAADKALLALLTDAQRRRWKNLVGQPFRFSGGVAGVSIGGPGTVLGRP